MRNIKLTIEYDGTHFNGWQVQPKGERTVQGKLEKALSIIFKKKVTVVGSGRTDSGVHALRQTANFKIDSSMTTEELLNALNANLPKDIRVHNAREVPLEFHSQYSIKRKAYQYCILNRPVASALSRDFCLHVPYKLNMASMRREARELVGRRDFRSFAATDRRKRDAGKDKNTVRNIYKAEIKKKGDYIYITIEANGFLYKMVRNIIGTLLDIGSGKLPNGSIKQILSMKDRTFASQTAKPHGLSLIKTIY